MSQTSIPIHSPAPAPQGPVACTLSPNEYAGRLDDFRHGVFNHLVEMERPEPTRLRLTLDEGADPGRVQELLVREQGCCAFMSFTLTPTTDRLVVDLEVPTEPRRPWTPWPCWPSWLPPGRPDDPRRLMSEQRLRTGELAERAGVNVQTLRYYERRGLLAAPTRRPSGQREYGEDAVRLLRTIKAVQRLGFTLAEIEELLDLSEHRRGTGELHRRAQAKVAEIDAKIDRLTKMRQALVAVLDADCDSLTDCSCGLGCPLPVLELAGPGDATGPR